MLDANFPRFKGEVGSIETFSFTTIYETAPAATVATATSAGGANAAVARSIAEAVRRLGARGCDLIVTSCGFLAPLQGKLAEIAGAPVIASALNLMPMLRGMYGAAAPIGVLTFNERTLGPAHFSAGWDPNRIEIEGLDHDGPLFRAISGDLAAVTREQAAEDAAAAARRLHLRRPDLAAVVLECTNLSPHREAIARVVDAPIFDLVQAIDWFREAKRRPSG